MFLHSACIAMQTISMQYMSVAMQTRCGCYVYKANNAFNQNADRRSPLFKHQESSPGLTRRSFLNGTNFAACAPRINLACTRRIFSNVTYPRGRFSLATNFQAAYFIFSIELFSIVLYFPLFRIFAISN